MKQRGATLVEILVALAISTFLLSVITMTLFAVNYTWTATTDQYILDTEIQTTLHLISDYLSDATEVYVQGNELRFRPAVGDLKALRYENGALNLYLYTSQDNSLSTSGSYEFLVTLSKHVAAPPVVNNNPAFQGRLTDGALLTISIPFTVTTRNIYGFPSTTTITHTLKVKLLFEG